MSEYHLEIKQLVDYPRCRIYREYSVEAPERLDGIAGKTDSLLPKNFGCQ